ncbi:MAG TPA: dihydrodipicolinate reductase C-terminal domain-containing protein [Terriglobales bacterium]|jgi:4-hydroxy-tetrahydrodipicolinate reductase|nr:dihydrodipicolinate reductase C-terminal domain-containing protein [Terriglobales bacterium]
MNLLILGRGKTGSLVAEAATERRHRVRVLCASENTNASALTPEHLADINVVVDFTTPSAVLANAEACIRAGKSIVVGTTGWYEHTQRLRAEVLRGNTGFLYGSNFSIGMNLFFEIVEASGPALGFEYSGQIFERHHTQKKDAPSGTAITLQNLLRQPDKPELEITSFREGDVVGMHEVVFNSPNDRIYLCHDSKSRRGFAEGAVRGAEWLAGKQGFFDFREIWKQL